MRQEFPLFFSTILEFLASSIRQKEEIKGIQIRKENIKLYHAGDMLLYLKDLKKS
jgi:hypothetical protein